MLDATDVQHRTFEVRNVGQMLDKRPTMLDMLVDLGWKILAECFDKSEVGIPSKMSDKYWPKA